MAAKKKLGRYKILGELGRGAMGVVYKAEDPALDRIVALKTIILSEGDAAGRKDYHARFFQEAKASARLTHPQIITVYDFGEEGDLAYLAMEFLKGTELRTRMTKGEISVPEAVHIAEQVAEGLGYAHEHGVVHRDIKPSNIMLLPHEQVKIMDFGIARMRASDHKTSTGLVLGTPKYMSPEQVAGAAVDHRSDIFSLGVVLYEMLTRSRLFSGEDTPQIFYNVVNVQPAPPSRLNPEVPPMLDFVLERALKKDPGVRYQDAFELAADRARRSRDRRGGKQGQRPGRHQDAQAGSQHSPPARGRDRVRHASSRVAQVRWFRGDEPAEGADQAGPRAAHPAAPAGRAPAPHQTRSGAALAVRCRRCGGPRRRRYRFRLMQARRRAVIPS
jgi:serine/threonine protein kinase